MADFHEGDLVEVWDGDVRRWVNGKVDATRTLPGRPGVFIMVLADDPDPGPLAVDKVPAVYAVGDHGFLRRRR